ncbi:cation:proton antiporter [Streptococcus halichoeri]|uniref:cation:proton antiporter n=1 Tax=Streptococcus halichoeri TaxID=254785 RepID=UPI00135C86C6|nr:cation:proton antiporter [Streptococcus halichoeri]
MHLIFEITVILFSSMLAILVSKRIGIPAVVGQLLVGIIVGPTLLDLVHQSQIIHFLSEIGVILLMFLAGLEANLALLKKYLKPSLLVAITGVVFPLVIFYFTTKATGYSTQTALFYGIVFAATSVSITVEVLQEYHKLKTRTGAVILGAAVADDILAVLLLSFFVSSRGASPHLIMQLVAQFLFLVFLLLAVKYFIPMLYRLVDKLRFFEMESYLALLICFAFALMADAVGMSAVIGSFFAGLAIGQTKQVMVIEEAISHLGYSFFIPIFFTSIALPLRFDGVLGHIWIIILFTILAVLSKLLPAYFVGRSFKFNHSDSLTIGGGMVSRGEMALIIVQIGLTAKIISNAVYSSLVIVVILSTIIAPFILKFSFEEGKPFKK